MIFFLTILSKNLFCCLDVFLSYWYIDRDGSMIRGKSLIWVNMMIILLSWIRLKKDKIQDQVWILTVIRIPGEKKSSRSRNFWLKGISNIKKNIPIKKTVLKVRIPKTIPNIKITCHNEDIVEVNFSILKILYMIEERNARNVPIIKKVLVKRKIKEWNINVNINDNSQSYDFESESWRR